MLRKLLHKSIPKKTPNLSLEETERLYQELSKTDTTKEQLEELLNEGQGVYAAMAASLLCDRIDTNAMLWGWGDAEYQLEGFKQKESYILKALEKNKVVGQYLLTLHQVGDAREIFQSNQLIHAPQSELAETQKCVESEISSSLKKFKSYIKSDPKSYEKLSLITQQEINEGIKNAPKNINPEIINAFKEVKSPLQVLEIGFKNFQNECKPSQVETKKEGFSFSRLFHINTSKQQADKASEHAEKASTSKEESFSVASLLRLG